MRKERNLAFADAKWKRPHSHTYRVNDDLQLNYYKPLLEYARNDKEKRGETVRLGYESYAERLVHHWPGQDARNKTHSKSSRRLRFDDENTRTISRNTRSTTPSPLRDFSEEDSLDSFGLQRSASDVNCDRCSVQRDIKSKMGKSFIPERYEDVSEDDFRPESQNTSSSFRSRSTASRPASGNSPSVSRPVSRNSQTSNDSKSSRSYQKENRKPRPHSYHEDWVLDEEASYDRKLVASKSPSNRSHSEREFTSPESSTSSVKSNASKNDLYFSQCRSRHDPDHIIESFSKHIPTSYVSLNLKKRGCPPPAKELIYHSFVKESDLHLYGVACPRCDVHGKDFDTIKTQEKEKELRENREGRHERSVKQYLERKPYVKKRFYF